MNPSDSKIIAVAAMAENRVIGKQGALPWHLPEDLKRFKELTMGHVLLMGRKTHESIGKALPGRVNLVLSRNAPARSETELRALSPGSVLELSDPEPAFRAWPESRRVFVIGGGEIYRNLLPRCEELVLTLLKRRYEGDVHMPDFENDFRFEKTLVDSPSFSILRYLRIQKP